MRAALLSLALGCHVSSEAVDAGPEAAPVDAAPSVVDSGGVRVLATKGAVSVGDPFDTARDKLSATLGPPHVSKDDVAMWGVVDGDDCWFERLQRSHAGVVSHVDGPSKVSRRQLGFDWDECLIAAGERTDPSDDPNAPGPPPNRTLTITELRDGVAHGRTKWNHAKVMVQGLYVGTSRILSDGFDGVTLSITSVKGALQDVVGCVLIDPASVPKLATYAPVVVTGTVDAPWRGSAVSLQRCAVTTR